MSVLIFLTAFWVVCPYVCATAEADQGVHACCTEVSGFEASTLCCGGMESNLYLPSTSPEMFSAAPVPLAVPPAPCFESKSALRLSGIDLVDPPKTLVSEKITLLL